MAKKSKSKTKKNNDIRKIENDIDTGFSTSFKNIILTIVVVLAIFGLFYLLALYATSKGEKKEIGPASIGYEKILAGSIFDREEEEYIVVLYDREEETDITSAVSSYNTKHDVDCYYVDLADGLNKSVISDRMNTDVKDASDLEVKNPSLLKVRKGKIIESVDGKSDIIDYLGK